LTFKDLKKRVALQTVQESKALECLHNKPFWIWNIEEHKQEDVNTNGDCCFNHIIGLPTKGGIWLNNQSLTTRNYYTIPS